MTQRAFQKPYADTLFRLRTETAVGCAALARPGDHPFGSLAFDSGCAMVKYEIGRGTFTLASLRARHSLDMRRA